MIASGLFPSDLESSRSSSRPLDSPSMIRLSSLWFTGSAASSAARASRIDAESTPSNRSNMADSGS